MEITREEIKNAAIKVLKNQFNLDDSYELACQIADELEGNEE